MGELIVLHGGRDRQGLRLLSKAEAAARLGVSERTVDRYRKQGLTCHLVGGRRWFSASDVERWAAERHA